MRVATTYLSPEEMGRLSLFTATTGFFAMFLVNPVGMFINRRLHAWDEMGRAKYYLKIYWIYLLAVSIIAAIVLTILNKFNTFGFQFDTIWLVVLVCGSLFFNTINQTVIPSLNLLSFRGWFIGLTLATIASGFFLAVILILYFKASAEYWLLGLLIGQIVFSSIGGKVFFGKLTAYAINDARRPTLTHIRLLFGFAWPIAIAVGMNWVQTQSYRFVIEDSLGLATLGLFVAGYGISAGLIAGFEQVLTTYFQPIFYKQISEGDRAEQEKAWTRYANAIIPSSLLIGFFVVAAAPELTRLLLGSNYNTSSQYIVWGAIAEMARLVTGVYGMIAHARMNTRMLILPNTIGAIISTLMMILLIPLNGATGVGVALAMAGIAVLIATYLSTRREFVTKVQYGPVIKSCASGGLLVTCAAMVRQVFDFKDVVSAFIFLGFLGIIFLFSEYWIIQPFIKIEDK
jgi:O-antigen/teichoic acid export membrane protein